MQDTDEARLLRFSKISTVLWAAALIIVAYLSRRRDYVLNAAFELRGLTSGALLGGLLLAVFGKKGRPTPVIIGMLVSFMLMSAIESLQKADYTRALWMKTFGTEIFWPWYTAIGAFITLTTASLLRRAESSSRPATDH
jgi:SSS family solute:Na+ symporter